MLKLVFLAGGMAVSALAVPASAATLIGDTVNCFRNGVACSGTSSATVGAGVEFNRGSSLYNFNGSGLTVTTLLSPGFSFNNPLVYSFENASNPFLSISNLSITGFSNFQPSRVSFANGRISIDLSGVRSNGQIRANLATATGSVPEPATWAMLLLGFFGVGAAVRSQRRRQKLTVSYA